MRSVRSTAYDNDSLQPRPAPQRGRRRRRRVPPLLLLVTLAAGVWMGWCLRGLADGDSTQDGVLGGLPLPSFSVSQASLKEPPECPEWIVQDLLPLNQYSRPGDKLDSVSGIVVHYVGNPGTTALQNHSYFASLAQTGETYASSHFLIDLDGSVLQNVPLDEVAYCSSQRNSDTISIECCHPDDTGAFTQQTYDSLVKLVVWLQDYYSLSSDQVIRHYDVTGKECPLYYVRHPGEWEAFLQDIRS